MKSEELPYLVSEPYNSTPESSICFFFSSILDFIFIFLVYGILKKFPSQMATATAAACSFHQVGIAPSLHKNFPLHHIKKATAPFIRGSRKSRKRVHDKAAVTKCSRRIGDFIGGDLLKLDIGQWLSDVEEHKALAIYSPHEGGYEGRYLNRLVHQGYHFLDLSARGLGDPETTLTKFHPVCPVRISCFYD